MPLIYPPCPIMPESISLKWHKGSKHSYSKSYVNCSRQLLEGGNINHLWIKKLSDRVSCIQFILVCLNGCKRKNVILPH